MNRIGTLIKKNDYYYCSECRMKQPLESECNFCGCSFSNFSELILEQNKFLEEQLIKEELWQK